MSIDLGRITVEPSIRANENINRPKGISRRTLVKGAAWSVPAVTVLGATPAFASSAECVDIGFTGTACKWPGANDLWSYQITLSLCNTCDFSVPVTISYLMNNSGAALTRCETTTPSYPSLPITTEVGPGLGNCQSLELGPFSSTSSAGTIEVYGYVGSSPVTPYRLESIKTTGQNPLPDCTGTSPCVPTP